MIFDRDFQCSSFSNSKEKIVLSIAILRASQVALVVKEPICQCRDVGLIPGLGRSFGGGHGNSSIVTWRIPGQRSLVEYGP